MLKLRISAASFWLSVIDGVRVFVPPLNTALLRTAEHVGYRAYSAAREAMGAPDGTELTDDQTPEMEGVFAQARIRAMAGKIEAWEGIAGEDDQPLPITPEALDAFAAHPALGRAFAIAYDASAAEAVAEGNGSKPSGSGKRRAEKPTVEAAQENAQPVPVS
jgi:hypothetical protein